MGEIDDYPLFLFRGWVRLSRFKRRLRRLLRCNGAISSPLAHRFSRFHRWQSRRLFPLERLRAMVAAVYPDTNGALLCFPSPLSRWVTAAPWAEDRPCAHLLRDRTPQQIGRASCRERV